MHTQEQKVLQGEWLPPEDFNGVDQMEFYFEALGIKSGLRPKSVNSYKKPNNSKSCFTYFPKPKSGKWQTAYEVITLTALTDSDLQKREETKRAKVEKVFEKATYSGRFGQQTATSLREERLRKARLEKINQKKKKAS